MIVKWRNKEYTLITRTHTARRDRSGRLSNVDSNMYAFDTESVNLPDRYEPITFQISAPEYGEDLVYIPPKTKALEFFLAYFIRKYSYRELDTRRCFLYGHNLMYDWAQLIKHYPDLLAIARTGIGLPEDYLIYEETDYKVILRKGGLFTGTAPHFTIRVQFSKREYFDIMFRDTYSFFPTSLSRIAKDLKLDQGKQERTEDLGLVDYRGMADCEKKTDFEEYAKRDALVTRLAAEKIRELHYAARMQRIRVSAPGYAINYLYHMIPEGTKILSGVDDQNIMQLILDTYAGGRTGGIYHGKVDNISVLDFHSSYPASMLTLPSFTHTMSYISAPEPDKLTIEEILDIINECHCFLRIDGEETNKLYPALITSVKNKLTPVYGEFKNLATTGVELSVGLKSGSIKLTKVHELVCLIETTDPDVLPFRLFASTLYKDKAEQPKGSVEYNRAKLGMNSSYGKLIESRTDTPVDDSVKNYIVPYIEGQETEFAEIYYKAYVESLNEESTDTWDQVYKDTSDLVLDQFGEDQLKFKTFGALSLTKLTYGRYVIPAAASLITATSRARLLTAMRALGAIYWDTDSVFVKAYDPERVNAILADASALLPDFIQPLKVGEELGDLDCEITGASGYLAGTKRYFLQNADGDIKRALHGIPTAPFDKAEEMIERLATGNNNPYEGKARPTGIKETKDCNEIGRFNSKKYVSQFQLDTRLDWEQTAGGWIGSVKSLEEFSRPEPPKTKYKNPEFRDPIIDIVLQHNGIKPERNGAYKEELCDLKYPYRNFTGGSSIDRITQIINDQLNIDYTANQLIDYIYDYIRSKKKREHEPQENNLIDLLDL